MAQKTDILEFNLQNIIPDQDDFDGSAHSDLEAEDEEEEQELAED